MRNPFRLPLPELLLRIALAGAFLYPAIHAVFEPYAWIGYFPGFVLSLAAGHEEVLLHAWGILEVALALWVLFGKKVLIPSVAMGVALVAVVIANPGQFPILFRDLSIALAAFALTLIDKKNHGN